jgi:pilus assembly protein Flp/PilA
MLDGVTRMFSRNRVRAAARAAAQAGRRGDDGATSIEYSLIASLIAVVVIAAVTLLGLNVLALFNLMPAGL